MQSSEPIPHLAFLNDLQDDAAKAKHLHDYVDDREVRGRIRYYEESAFIMNE